MSSGPVAGNRKTLFPFPLVVVLAAYAALRIRYLWVPPIWDGRSHFELLLKAVAQPFDLLNYSLFGHICQGFMLLMAVPVWLFGPDYVAFNLWLAMFSLLGVWAVFHLLHLLTGGRLGDREAALGVALFAFHPSVISNMIHFNTDAGAVTFLLLYWLCVWKGWREGAVISGVFALFSCEIAFALLPLPVGFCWLMQPAGSRGPWLKRQWAPLVIPYALLAAFIVYKSIYRGYPALWSGWQPQGGMLWHDGFTPQLKNFLFFIVALNFQWVFSAIWLVALAAAWKRRSETERALARRSLLVLCGLAAVTYAVTRVMPYSHVRYALAAIPFVLLGMFCVLPACIRPDGARMGVYAVLLALLLAQDFRLVDPVSKARYHTFMFGEHPMLDIAGEGHECCAQYGRDQLVYNLEFLKFAQLSELVIRDLRPAASAYIVSQEGHGPWSYLTPLEPNGPNAYRTSYMPGSFSPHYLTTWQLLAMKPLPDELHYLSFANYNNAEDLQNLGQVYAQRISSHYALDGYSVEVDRFTRLRTSQRP